ncbi:arginine repressor [Marinilactibacillus psychrotolerans]|uniref:Arginine repressor n=2 Tax=Marinilactibacillus psychrotolerans TaxID=191770 RepID=A0A511GYA7_9LACT|nr:arginine repressor [Marinilactibacillus psychrotolerans]TLQ05530.1 arginine repressor [Marinilactibacillus psychrotolerans]SDC25324.1 transcriptional regulator, ArgR family [Marinilactibacillus psychrotolerans]SJN42359.1 Arginine pathway regulatory protein ArgR, repressor of arg regulon [Marinilactibacillus psychrotolerans 42ea]GEL66251.1 arginine regulator [Marinilactibacillus psychrotolerans]GEQ32562.1 arginine repressor [Marinilactibacillus psychrotolerans]
MKKSERQMMIKQMVLNEEIGTQDELLNKLKNKGIDATQATISRDIKELNLVKTPSVNGGTKYTIYQNNQLTIEDKLSSTLREVVDNITQVQFMNVVKTIPGNAHVIGALMDDIPFTEVVGTVAGNDTIMIISKNEYEATKMYNYLTDRMHKALQ